MILKPAYVASRASNPARPAMWLKLRAEGWPIISTWIDEAAYAGTIDHSELWQRIGSEVFRSSGLVMYVSAEDLPIKGAYIEAGMALGMGRPVALVLDDIQLQEQCRPIGSWILHPLVKLFGTVEEALEYICGGVPHAPL